MQLSANCGWRAVLRGARASPSTHLASPSDATRPRPPHHGERPGPCARYRFCRATITMQLTPNASTAAVTITSIASEFTCWI